MLLLYSVSMRACVCFLFFSEEKNAIFGESDSTILLHSPEFQASVTQNSKASTLSSRQLGDKNEENRIAEISLMYHCIKIIFKYFTEC